MIRWRSQSAEQCASRLAHRYRSALCIGGCFCVVLAASASVGLDDRGSLIWIANGLLLSYLLVVSRRLWLHYLAVGFMAQFLAGFLWDQGHWPAHVALAGLNVGEVFVGAILLRKASTEPPRFTDRAYLLKFTAYAVVIGPTCVGLIFACIYALWMRSAPWHALLIWITTDGVGTAIVTPGCVAMIQSKLAIKGRLRSLWIWPLLLVGITVGAFAQTQLPIIFLLYPFLALVLFRFGLGWASVSAMFVAVIGGWFTIQGYGPFAVIAPFTGVSATALLQFYIASGMFMVFAASSVMDNLRATKRRLQEIVSLHQLLTENSRDAIILADLDGKRNFVSAAGQAMTGWSQAEMLSQQSLDIVHPEDKPIAGAVFRELLEGRPDALIECRIRKQDGHYLWVEANLHAIKDEQTGAPVGFLNMVRDISTRKHAERELKNAYKALEALAVTDPLTRLANRRQFDHGLAEEWRRGFREQQALSLLMIDADWFKSYNDTYGHPRGDSCLKQIAESAQDVVTRAGDLVARIGGEEFAVLLPNTTSEGAMEVAESICAALRQRKLPHRTNPVGYMTVSVGCATLIPGPGQHSSTLVQRADDAMYTAKRNGRNQVCCADTEAEASMAQHKPTIPVSRKCESLVDHALEERRLEQAVEVVV